MSLSLCSRARNIRSLRIKPIFPSHITLLTLFLHTHRVLPSTLSTFPRNATSRTIRRLIQTQRFEPLKPPSPQSLGKAAPAKQYSRLIKWSRKLIYASALTGVLYGLDTQFNASSITRSLRTFGMGVLVAVDYKLNFRPEPFLGGDITDLHRRNAERLFNLLRQNGGLYLKIGQAIAMQSAVLPPEFQKMFSRMFDDAPQNGWDDVEKVIREDFGGRSPEEVFGVSFSNTPGKGVMEKKARASASVAQVHWARLPTGEYVLSSSLKARSLRAVSRVGRTTQDS
jgi:aarF domain-containing kinase